MIIEDSLNIEIENIELYKPTGCKEKKDVKKREKKKKEDKRIESKGKKKNTQFRNQVLT